MEVTRVFQMGEHLTMDHLKNTATKPRLLVQTGTSKVPPSAIFVSSEEP